MRSTAQIGLKITAATREYYRYTGPSADLERRGAGSSRPELAGPNRTPTQADTLTPTPDAPETPDQVQR